MGERKLVLPAKMIRPRFTGVFPRRRLFRLLDQGRKQPVVWVTGHPGSGKSVLVSSFFDARRLNGLWYRFDPGDRDPAGFFYHLSLAVQKAAPRARSPLPLLTPEYRGDLSTFARGYFRGLFAHIKPPFVLVFDDCHLLPQEDPLFELIKIGMKEALPGFCFIFISRDDPPPPFSSLVVERAMRIIDPQMLRLTEEEAVGVVRRVFPSMNPEAARALHRQAQGWAAGLILLGEEAAHSERPLSEGGPGVTSRTFDYFAREIFGRMKPSVQDLLMQSSFLPEITVERAEALTGQRQASALLDDLYRRRYFIEKQNQIRGGYRYHDLFRDFLNAQAERTYPRNQLRSIQRRAGKILARAGQAGEAIELYLKVEAWPEATALIVSAAGSMISQGRSQTVQGWILALPEEILDRQPWLLYWRGVCRLPFVPSESRGDFERAFKRFRERGDQTGIWLAWSMVIDTFLHECENYTPLDQWIALMEESLLKEETMTVLSPEIEARAASGMLNALLLKQPHHPNIAVWADRVFSLMQKEEDANFRLQIGYYLALYTLWIGDYSKTARVINLLHQAARSPAASPLMQLTGKSAEAQMAWLNGSFSDCLTLVSEGIKLARERGVHLWDHDLLSHGVAAALSIEDHATATSLLLEREAVLSGWRRFDRAFYHYLTGWMALQRGDDLAGALNHAETALGISLEMNAPYPEAICRLLLADIFVERRAFRQAGRERGRARRIGLGMKSLQIEFIYLISVAWRLRSGGKPGKQIKRALHRALILGREQGYINIFGWRSSVMACLCLTALEAGIETDYVCELVRKRNLIPDPPPIECEAWPWAVKVYTLGRFTLLIDEEAVRFASRGQGKVLELLKALITFGGREVGEERLTDALWPETEGSKGRQLFKITLHRLRRLLGKQEAITLRAGKVTLDPRFCWVDAWAFERLLSACPEKALNLYRGPFLGREEPPEWALPLQKRLHDRYLLHLISLGTEREASSAFEEAAACYQRGLETDPFAEECYRRLMICRQKQGRRAEALAIYDRCRKILQTMLQTEPAPETAALYETIKRSVT